MTVQGPACVGGTLVGMSRPAVLIDISSHLHMCISGMVQHVPRSVARTLNAIKYWKIMAPRIVEMRFKLSVSALMGNSAEAISRSVYIALVSHTHGVLGLHYSPHTTCGLHQENVGTGNGQLHLLELC